MRKLFLWPNSRPALNGGMRGHKCPYELRGKVGKNFSLSLLPLAVSVSEYLPLTNPELLLLSVATLCLCISLSQKADAKLENKGAISNNHSRSAITITQMPTGSPCAPPLLLPE